MPVTVHVPIRVRVDVDALTSRLDEIGAALAAAVGRALASSRAVAVEPRGGYLGLRVHEPTFTWPGKSLDRVSANTRRILEMQIRSLILAQAERRLVGDRRDRFAPEPVPSNPSEAIDESRYWDVVHHYVVPSYDGGGKKILAPVEVITFSENETQVHETMGWATGGSPEELMPLFLAMLAERNRKPPTSGHLGFMFAVPGGYCIQILKFDGDNYEGVWRDEVVVRVPTWNQEKKKFVTVLNPLRPVGSFALKAVGGAVSATAEAKRIFETHLLEHVLPQLVKTAPVDLEPGDIDRMFTKVAAAEFDKLVSGHQGSLYFAQLGLPSQQQTLLLLNAPPPSGTIEIVPLAVMRPAPRRGLGAGTGAGARTGKGVLDPSILRRAQGRESEAQLHLLNATAEGTGSSYPSFEGGKELSWEPFEGEPSVDALGEDGKILRELMERIAGRLAITGWKPYAGRFLMNAAAAVGTRAHDVQVDAVGEDMMLGQAEQIGLLIGMTALSSLGRVHFQPKPSKAMAFHKYILATAPWVNLLYDAVRRVFTSDAHAAQLENLTAGRDHWLLHVLEEYRSTLREACGWIFVYACQSMMLQLLGSSKRAIKRRVELREAYAGFFYRAVITQLSSEAELLRLREGLQHAIDRTAEGQRVSSHDVVFSDKWARYQTQRNIQFAPPRLAGAAARDLDRQLLKLGELPRTASPEGNIVYKDGQPAIVDDFGNAWTVKDLDLTIQVRQSSAMAIDPILNHFLHEHGLEEVHRYTGKQTAEALYALLQTMLDKNEETTNDTLNQTGYAFEKGKIVEISDVNDAHYMPSHRVAGYDLQGIHLIAWQELTGDVGSDPILEDAIDAVFARELGFRSLKSFGEFVGIALLAVVCPPLAEGIMIAQAVAGVIEAKKLEGFYQSFIDPDQLVSWADVQAELFAAKISLAIALLPGAGRIVRGVLPRARTLLQSGLKKGFLAEMRAELTAVFEGLARELKQDLLKAFLGELVKNYVLSNAIEKMMAPLVDEVARKAALPAYEK